VPRLFQGHILGDPQPFYEVGNTRWLYLDGHSFYNHLILISSAF
jgi:hypothetical protein